MSMCTVCRVCQSTKATVHELRTSMSPVRFTKLDVQWSSFGKFEHFSNSTMETRREIRVLSAFYPFLRMLHALDFANSGHSRKRPHSPQKQDIVCVARVAVLMITPPIVVASAIWHMTEDDLTMGEFSTAFALIVAYTQMFAIYTALMVKNRMIADTMENIEKSINGRKCSTISA